VQAEYDVYAVALIRHAILRSNNEIKAEWMKMGKIKGPISNSGRPPLHALPGCSATESESGRPSFSSETSRNCVEGIIVATSTTSVSFSTWLTSPQIVRDISRDDHSKLEGLKPSTTGVG
jgi:hypothetical protein